jgi:hypothetical protein
MSERMERIRVFAEEQRQFDIEEGRRLERERIIAMLLDGWASENSPIIAAIKGDN